ncbi:MAG: MotA/TolQ/ExbB proton channel family protein [bacterium]
MDSLNKIIDYCEGKDIPVAKVLKAGLLEFDEGIMGMKSAITSANMHESAVMEKGLSLLGMLGNIAPLLGLLGTVTGMISAFEMISIGGSGRPEIVASGISMALVTTAGGLFVGIPLVLAYHFIQNKIENLLVDLQEFSVDVSEKLFRECRR